jgi:hypothetical protein
MFSPGILYKITTALMLCGLLMGGRGYSKTPPVALPYQSLCEQGQQALQRMDHDSATILFLRAYQQGMAAESLYYYWAEVYRSKGVYDSALTLNYAQSTLPQTTLRFKTLLQRQGLYRQLKWQEDADALSDSLWHFAPYRHRYLQPTVDIRANFGYGSKSTLSNGWPATQMLAENEQGVGGRARGELTWDSPRFLRGHLLYGIYGDIAKPYWTQTASSASDSLSSGGGVFVKVNDIAKKLSVHYRNSLQRTWDTQLRFQHLGEATLYTMVGPWLGYVLGGVEVGFDTLYSHDNLQWWAGTGLTQGTTERLRWSFSLFANGLVDEPLQGLTVKKLYMDDVTLQKPRFYASSSTSDTIAYSYFTPARDIAAAVREYDVVTTLPQTSVSLQPRVGAEFELRRYRIKLAAGAFFALYPQPYAWYDLITADGLQIDGYTVIDKAGGGSYWLPDEVLVNANQGLLSRPVARSVHNVKRIDFGPSAELSVETTLGRWGVATLATSFSDNLSPTREKLPVEVAGVSWSVGLEWTKTVTPIRY